MALFQRAIQDNTNARRNDNAMIERYSKRLERFAKSQANFEDSVTELQKLSRQLEVVMKDYDSREHDQQLNNVNLALDLKYLKEQGDQLFENCGVKLIGSINSLGSQLEKANNEMEELKAELQQMREETMGHQKVVSKKIGKLHVLQTLQFIVELATAAGVVILLLKLFNLL